jgi:hypothetical protein
MPDLASNTNQAYRKKYFVDFGKVLFCPKVNPDEQPHPLSRVIDATNVVVAKHPIEVHVRRGPDNDQIKVDTIREGQKVKSIRIACPCGRRAALDVEYAE